MRLLARRDDDADVIRARLRAVLAEPRPAADGWLPDDEDGPGWPADDRITVPVEVPTPETRPAGGGRHRAPGTTPRWDAGRGGSRAVWTAAAVAVLLLLAWTWAQRPQVQPAAAPLPVPSAPSSAPADGPPVGEVAATTAPVVVAVVGLVTLPAGARVADAVAAAGGLLPDADPASVNLAAPLSDGQQVAVGVPGAAAGGPPASAGSGAAAPGGRLDLNTAGVAELDALPGIGPVLAQRIVDHRSRVGAFGSVEELDEVPGIGPAKAAELADLVQV
ncbi:competence protein ComEA [Blastococcus sp. MG754426]|uniref:ComEA family DNA-binding protein n=1 Tax=unclassified Blastococcus TaxID=2619396 RepID=UPI001EF0B5D5|nr:MULTISPECIES: ComEA family DNA-binding protein [unclassified Blastococcus]MCF6507637.1 competence protein ComEA [Blastococcus sp. MG754426]MCF6512720.1 competence protein ComEA [Blastococcus sp. MG754427]